MNREQVLDKISTRNWLVLMVIGGISLFCMTPVFTFGVFMGGLIVIANFHSLHKTVNRTFLKNLPLHRKKILIILNFYFRLAIIVAIVYILCDIGKVSVVGILVGLSVVIISIITVALYPADGSELTGKT